MSGFEQTAGIVRLGCLEGLAGGQLAERLLAAVREFAGEKAQGDDQTVAVVSLRDEG